MRISDWSSDVCSSDLPLWLPFPGHFVKSCAITSRLLQFRSPLLSESRLMSFPRATEIFQFTRFASHDYIFIMRYLLLGGFPHSEISGSMLICSPKLIAGFHVFRRLSSPRHPPHALSHLTVAQRACSWVTSGGRVSNVWETARWTGLYRDWETDRKSTRLNSSH